MKLAIGSTRDSKVEAAKEAWEIFSKKVELAPSGETYFVSFDVPTSSPNMPLAAEEVMQGAQDRADRLMLQLKKEKAEADPSTMAASAKIATRVFPDLTNINIARVWCGLEGKMPDDIPVIGASATEEGGYHAFGFCGHGFQLSPIVGKLIAELIVEGRPSLSLDAFSISRFARE